MATYYAHRADHAAIIANIHATYDSTGEAAPDHKTGLTVDHGKLPDGRWVHVSYDRDDGNDEWGLDLVRAVEVDDEED